uniref:Cytochrome P450 3130A1 n=1 Tax=Paracyclopina nana TaxID=565004 RepID=A0A0F7IZY1_PARNA|nr:cytochrome P450 3130A1 [Paracyclopina nana]
MWDILVVFLAVLAVATYIKAWSHPKDFAPGPNLALPIVGNAWMFGPDLILGMEKLKSVYGNVVGFWLGPQRCVAVFDFDTLQDILSKPETTDRQAIKMGRVMRRGQSLEGDPGVLSSSGQTWMEMRRFSLHTLRDFGVGKNILEDVIDDEVSSLIQHIDDNFVNQPVDVRQLFNVAVLASLWRIISGESLKTGDPKLQQLVTYVQTITQEFGSPLVAVGLNHPWLLNVLIATGYSKFLQGVHDLFDFCKSLLETHKSQAIDSQNPLTFTEATLGKIRETQDRNSPFHQELGDLNLLSILVDFFIAGSDTTSNSINWAMLYMIKHPDIQSKVRQELDAKVGPNKRARMSERHLTPYTEAVIHEIQRKGNILPASVFHQTTENSRIQIGNYSIPPKTVIIPMIGSIMHDPEHFDNPSLFNPDRFLTQDHDLKFTPHPRVIPFGVGKRRCLGEIMARTTLYKFFTALVQKYEIISGQSEPIEDISDIGVVRNPTKYKLIFKPRKSHS